MVDGTDTFVREVDEELRREQIQRIWARYGVVIVGAAALLLAGIGGYKYWESRKITAIEASGARFDAASRLAAEGKSDDALKEFEAIAKSSPQGYRTLARLQLAGAQIKAGKSDAALALYEALSKDTQVDALLRDFSALQAAMLRLDVADWTEMENRLTPLMVDKSPWRAMARETLGLAAYKAGKADEARKLFEQTLGDRLSPPAVAERAVLLMTLLTDAAAAKSPADMKDTGSPPPKTGPAQSTSPLLKKK